MTNMAMPKKVGISIINVHPSKHRRQPKTGNELRKLRLIELLPLLPPYCVGR